MKMKSNIKTLFTLLILVMTLSSCQMLGITNKPYQVDSGEIKQEILFSEERSQAEDSQDPGDNEALEGETTDNEDADNEQADPNSQEILQELEEVEEVDSDHLDFTRLINKYNPIPDDYEFELANYNDKIQVDARILDDLNEMMAAMEEEGLTPTITYGFRKHETQVELFDQGVKKRMNQGMSYEQAYDATSFTTAIPGTSEHEVGLAVDIKEKNGYQNYRLENIYSWLRANAHKYGFILRYDQDKTEITEIMYEPWHFRYVGKEEAPKIKESGLAIEEYFEKNE